MSNAVIQFQDVSKSFGQQKVLTDFSLKIPSGEFLTIIGRSGCGKTTVIKLINRLIMPDKGNVLVRGENTADCQPVLLRRQIGYAIQNVGLFPHMTVEKNIAYVPLLSKAEGWGKSQRRERVEALLKQVGLDPSLAGRFPRTLSGGQRQRVGIARALAASPDIMLMDEPFGAVDEITRGQLQDEILRIHEERKLTILFVTHDIAEALKLGTRTLVMDAGKIEQCAPPAVLLSQPETPFVEQLVCRNRSFSVRRQ